MKTGTGPVVKATEADAGCWLEGSRGWTASATLVRIAVERGAALDAADERFLSSYEAGDGDRTACGVCGGQVFTMTEGTAGGTQTTWVHGVVAMHDYVAEGIEPHDAEPVDVAEVVIGQGGLTDQAEEWLNENVAPEGFTFGWHDGEFFLWADTEWEAQS